MRISDWSSDVCSSDLTTAFVATYVRLHTGGSGSGFARDALPGALRSAHDEIIDMRNKRYAHVAEHDSFGSVAKIVKLEHRSEERRVGKECVCTVRSRGSPYL